MRLFSSIRLVAVAAAVCLPSFSHAALTADELLLIVNKNAPAGVELAEYYAKQRGVEESRILKLDLPAADEISMDEFEQRITEPVRAAVIQPALGGKIRCLVTFMGVPFRIPPRPRTPELLAELKLISEERSKLAGMMSNFADQGDALAREIDPSFEPDRTTGDDAPFARLRHASEFSASHLGKIEPIERRQDLNSRWEAIWEAIQAPLPEPGPRVTTQQSSLPTYPHSTNLGSAELRHKARINAHKAGAIACYQILTIQLQFLSLEQADAAVDSELATVLWGPHIMEKWQGNPLSFRAAVRNRPGPHTLMTTRLDGPSSEVVRRLIDDSIAAEREGLRGKIVLDSWAKPEKKPDGTVDGYGRYDQTIRSLERLLTAKQQKCPVVFEASDALIPENSQSDIAVYCGWYDPNHVQLPGKFARGAIAFHIASYTAVGLHGQGGGWWVPALLENGVCATIGPVAEPYLFAFPSADEFIPLMLTGKLTFAEAYWKTNPLVSWKMLAIGDPLYTPFKTNPVLSDADLPGDLKAALAE